MQAYLFLEIHQQGAYILVLCDLMMTVQFVYQLAIFGDAADKRQKMVTGAYWGWASDIVYQISTYYVYNSIEKLVVQSFNSY